MKTFKILLPVFCLIFFSCSKEEHEIVNLNGNKIAVLGHGGLGVGQSDYPFNSYEGIAKTINMGADGAELDVQITKDSVLVAFHDTYLEESTDGNGEIYTKTWDEIRNYSYKGYPYEVYKIASLDQIFSSLVNEKSVYTFDIKFNNPDRSDSTTDIFHRAIIRIVEKYHLEKIISIEAPSKEFLSSLKSKKNNLNLFIYSGYDEALQIAKDYGFKGITIKSDEISADQVKAAHNSGIWVAVFSATRRNHEEIIKKNVDIIQTDDIEDLLERLK